MASSSGFTKPTAQNKAGNIGYFFAILFPVAKAKALLDVLKLKGFIPLFPIALKAVFIYLSLIKNIL